MTDNLSSTSEVSEPFESYTGDDPYIFVSYAHIDKAFVYNTLRYINDSKVNVWYDEGIQPSTEWVEEIAQAIKKSSLFVLFMSPSAVVSRFVRNEINYAVSLDKNILTIYLEETLLPEGLALCLQPYQSLEVHENDWLVKACSAIQSQINQINSDNLVEFAENAMPDTSIDLGEKLWGHLKRAIRVQSNRLNKTPGKQTILRVAQETTLKANDSMSPPSSSPDRTKAGRTRHPWAVNVEVSEETNSIDSNKLFEDPFAGTFYWIPPGEISIWVPYAEEQRTVRVSQGFWMAKYPVTQEIYHSIMGTNPSSPESPNQGQGINLPVNNVSWLDSVSFCKALTILARNQQTLQPDLEFRLPSEVEWEYACRAGSTADYYFGDDPNDLHFHGWFKANSNKSIHQVGMKSPNPWGLHDLYGNVREWVGKSFANTLLNDSEQDEFRISRGGGYMKTASECKSASRSTNSLHHRFRNLGFRLALAKVPDSVEKKVE